ncbi:MAG: DUF7507 domain-containing protein, partial [Limisphaerales bacterium]
TTAPAIAVTLACPAVSASPGGSITYTGTVRNSGNVTLNNVVVASNQSSANSPVVSSITLTNGGVTVSWTATPGSTYSLQYKSNLSDPVWKDIPGDVTASGATASKEDVLGVDRQRIYRVRIVSEVSGSPLIGPLTLAPGAVTNFTASLTAPADSCSVSATVTATGSDNCTAVLVSDTASVTCPLITAPSIVVTQVCPANPTLAGALLTYTGTVSNVGNVTLTNVVVMNDLSGATPVFTAATLAPGAVVSFTGSYVAPTNCSTTSTSTATARSICGVAVTNTVSATCPITTTPLLVITQSCPVAAVSPGGLLTYSGSVSNAGDITLTNVVVLNNLSGATPVFTAAALAPGAVASFTGSYVAPTNCSTTSTSTVTGRTICGVAITNTVSANCPVVTTPGISITESCPPGPVSAGSSVVFGGSVSNTGNVTLTNVLVFSSQPTNNTPVLGPITLVSGESAPFTGSYIALGGSNPTTNSTIVTNSSDTITTNVVSTIITNNTVTVTTNEPTATSFGTINSVTTNVVDRFVIGTNFNGLTYASEDHGYGATEFYSMRKDTNGASFFDTIIAGTATTTDQFNAPTVPDPNLTFDALTYAADNVGYGPLLFYYISHDNAGVSTFGSITPGGVVGVTAPLFVVPGNVDALTYTATDVGYGADMFYYVSHDATGLSTFGTINPALPGTVTPRFTIGTNVDALVFTDLIAPGFGADNFYYLRHDGSGVSTFGTIFVTSPTTGTVTDRFTVGTNATELTFTATDVGFGANLFYYLRGSGLSLTTNNVTTYTTNTVTTLITNTVTTFTTNTVVTFTPTNTVTATGIDTCQARTVAAAADCLGPVGPVASAAQSMPAVQPPVTVIGGLTMTKGVFGLSFATENGRSYTVQYKNTLADPIWTDLETVGGTGGNVTVLDPAATQPTRFYRVMPAP